MTPVQCKMARAAIGLSVVDLAKLSGTNKNTVVNFENGKDTYTSTASKLQLAIESTGKIRFEGDGCVCVITNEPKGPITTDGLGKEGTFQKTVPL